MVADKVLHNVGQIYLCRLISWYLLPHLPPFTLKLVASLNYYGFSGFHAFAQTVPFAQNISLTCLLGELSFHPHCLMNLSILQDRLRK